MCYYNRIYAKYDHTKTSPFLKSKALKFSKLMT